MSAKTSDSRKGQPGFEHRLERLETLADKLRDGNIPLEDALAVFEEGMKLAKTLERDLARVERRVEILTREPQSAEEDPGLGLFPELGEEE